MHTFKLNPPLITSVRLSVAVERSLEKTRDSYIYQNEGLGSGGDDMADEWENLRRQAKKIERVLEVILGAGRLIPVPFPDHTSSALIGTLRDFSFSQRSDSVCFLFAPEGESFGLFETRAADALRYSLRRRGRSIEGRRGISFER